MNRGPAAEIDLSCLHHNLGIINAITGARPVIAVVKADAYGHGSVEISRRLLAEGLSTFAVAYTGEAKTLRESGINAKIIVLFDRTDIDDYFNYDLVPVIQDLKTAEKFSKEASRRNVRIRVHLKIDTGMGRTGFMPERAVDDTLRIADMQGLEIEGLMSHFSEADLSDRSYAMLQIDIFRNIRREISERTGRSDIMAHMANSAAVLSLKEALFDLVRPGIMLYGCSPFREDYGLRPLMKIKTRILVVRDLAAGSPVSYGRTFIAKRDSRIAVVPTGYADGYSRLFSNNAEVLAGGRRVPVVGRVCMDVTMIDVTDAGDISEGDEVVLLGQQGDEIITAGELSLRINTIPYDIVTSLGPRARKEYIN